MEELRHTRIAAREAVEDIEPAPFRARLDDVLENAWLAPGALTVLVARSVDDDVDRAAVGSRAAGVQLSYDGLRLSRGLIDSEPWAAPDATDAEIADGDLDLLAAEVLFSRGFYHLATTGVATETVEIVRRFGRNQSALATDGTAPDPTIEAEFLKLAVEAGVDFSLGRVPEGVSAYGDRLGREIRPSDAVEEALADVPTRIRQLLADDDGADVDASHSSAADS